MKKVLFLLKQNQTSGEYNSTTSKSGLLNSAKLTAEFLDSRNFVKTKVVICVDGNSVDKEVYEYQPDFCVLEALWVTPEKLTEIQKLHPKVKFLIRIHSEVAFLANEGVALSWINEYSFIPNVYISLNSSSAYRDFKAALKLKNLAYLPNLYPLQSEIGIKKLWRRELHYLFDSSKHSFNKDKRINVSCFGAIRPMKNNLVQAFAALEFSRKHKVPINFHINGTRVEQGGEPNLKNIRALFKGSNNRLIEHPWLEREDFLKLIRTMDVGMQMSFSESFNIVSADFVSQKVPIIVSEDISWMPAITKSKPTDTEEIANQLANALRYEDLFVDTSTIKLNKYIKAAFEEWAKFLFL